MKSKLIAILFCLLLVLLFSPLIGAQAQISVDTYYNGQLIWSGNTSDGWSAWVTLAMHDGKPNSVISSMNTQEDKVNHLYIPYDTKPAQITVTACGHYLSVIATLYRPDDNFYEQVANTIFMKPNFYCGAGSSVYLPITNK